MNRPGIVFTLGAVALGFILCVLLQSGVARAQEYQANYREAECRGLAGVPVRTTNNVVCLRPSALFWEARP